MLKRHSIYTTIAFFTALLGCLTSAHAQKITVSAEARELEGLRRRGMGCMIEYDKRTVEKAWNRQLKNLGKADSWKSGAQVILAPNMASQDFSGLDLISLVSATSEGTKLFLALGQKGDYAEPGSQEYERGRALLQAFARQLARDDISEQIAAAEKVVDIAARTHDKTMSIGEQLQRTLERNGKEQQNLQKALEENRLESERLRAEILQNKADQESALEEIKKVRKIAEDRKTRLQQL
jgi:hypothetical protein